MKSRKKYYLFTVFPIDHELLSSLPIPLMPGVKIDHSPKYDLCFAQGNDFSKEKNIALAGFVYPGFGLNDGMCNYCIIIDSSIPDCDKDGLFWMAVVALFIAKPLFMNITGAFYSGDRDIGFVKSPQAIGLRSNLSLQGMDQKLEISYKKCFDKDDIECARILIKRIVQIRKSQKSMQRPNYNLNIFCQLTFWEKLHYENSIFSKLFAFLDSFACNPSAKQEKRISERISTFLSDLAIDLHPLSKVSIKNRLEYIWSLHRYPDVHGHIKPPMPISIETPNGAFHFDSAKDLYCLFEIARLCLHKFLLLPIDKFEEYAKILIPPIGFSSKEAAVINDKKDRDANTFFGNLYDNPPELKPFFDFIDPKEIE